MNSLKIAYEAGAGLMVTVLMLGALADDYGRVYFRNRKQRVNQPPTK